MIKSSHFYRKIHLPQGQSYFNKADKFLNDNSMDNFDWYGQNHSSFMSYHNQPDSTYMLSSGRFSSNSSMSIKKSQISKFRNTQVIK